MPSTEYVSHVLSFGFLAIRGAMFRAFHRMVIHFRMTNAFSAPNTKMWTTICFSFADQVAVISGIEVVLNVYIQNLCHFGS